jgi:hypothetical protein
MRLEPVVAAAAALALLGVALLAVHMLAVLVTGGYRLRLPGGTLTGADPIQPLILLLVLLVVHVPLARRSVSLEVFRAHDVRIVLCLALLAYLATGKTLSTPDTLPARCLPWALLHGQGFTLDAFSGLHGGTPASPPYFLRFVSGHWLSDYPVAAALLAVPVYVPSALGWADPGGRILIDLEKLAAALITALSVLCLYATLRRLCRLWPAVAITAVYALGTSSLSVSSQALWQHGASQLAWTAAFYCVVRARNEFRWVALAGFALAFAVIARPMNLLLAAPVALHALIAYPRRAFFVVGGLPPLLFQVWYNVHYFGNAFRTQFPVLDIWSTPILEGLAGILMSPGRGLLIYSPVLAFSLLGLVAAWRRDGDALLRTIGIGVVATILLYGKYTVWWGGWTYGPRLLADLTPALALLLVPTWGWLGRHRALAALFVLLTCWSVGAHAIGTWQRAPYWNADVDSAQFTRHLWSWTDNQIVNPIRAAWDEWWITLRSVPTSANEPGRLAAVYRGGVAAERVSPGGTVRIRVEALNRGEAVWLAQPADGRGAVALRWRWLSRGGGADAEGWVRLRYNVFPGRSYLFERTIPAPGHAGPYGLELELIRMPEAPFSRLGVAPVRIPIHVQAQQEE